MIHAMIVQIPVSTAFGTDEEFDLRVRLEAELAAAIEGSGIGTCGGGEINTTDMRIILEAIADPDSALALIKNVLSAAGLLVRAMVILESRSHADPDEAAHRVLWPVNHSGKFRVA